MKKWIPLGLALLAALTLLTGCELFSRNFYLSQEDFPDPHLGSLVLFLSDGEIGTRTLAPPNMTVSYYDLTFSCLTSPGSSFVEDDLPVTAAYAKNGLTPGSWTVAVVALDSVMAPIGAIGGGVAGQNTVGFTVTAGNVVSAQASVVPLVGMGKLSLTLSWPPAVLDAPVSVTASLVRKNPDGSTTPRALAFNVNDATRVATYISPDPADIDNGYYTLLLQLFGFGSVTPDWGWVESTRIVTGITTTGLLALSSGSGGLQLDIDVDMQNPILITWLESTPATTIALGGTITLTANPDPATPTSGYQYDYQWYCDGALVAGQTAAAITYGDTLPAGDHSLCVVLTERLASDANAIRTISSHGHTFRVE